MGMNNSNALAIMTGKPRELNQGGTSTSKTVFTVDGTEPVICYLPSSGQLSGANPLGAARFCVRAWGRVVTAGSYNFTATIQYGNS